MLSDAFDLDVVDHHVLARTVLAAGWRFADLVDHVHTLHNFTEHAMAAVEVRGWPERDEKLTAVRARSGVGHREDAGFAVFEIRRKFIGESISGAAAACTFGA